MQFGLLWAHFILDKANHSQMRDIISDGKNGLLTENDPEGILEKLLYIKVNPERAKIFGRRPD